MLTIASVYTDVYKRTLYVRMDDNDYFYGLINPNQVSSQRPIMGTSW